MEKKLRTYGSQQKLKYVFNMNEIDFFEHYSKKDNSMTIDYYKKCKALYDSIYKSIPELPFSNTYKRGVRACHRYG